MGMEELSRMVEHHNSLPGAQLKVFPGNSRRKVVDIYRDGACLLQTLELNTAIHVVASLINAKTQDISREEKASQLTTKDRAMALYNESQRVFNEDNDAYYIAKNLEYLARCVEPSEEIPLEDLYQLAERLLDKDCLFYQPLLNEERLDAVRALLENGMSSERPPFYEDLTPEQTLEFLLTCDSDSFAFAVERRAAYNQELYGAEPFDSIGEASFEKALESFRSEQEKPPLTERIADAESRQGVSATDTPNKEPELQH